MHVPLVLRYQRTLEEELNILDAKGLQQNLCTQG
jgi:hypothetical protein